MGTGLAAAVMMTVAIATKSSALALIACVLAHVMTAKKSKKLNEWEFLCVLALMNVHCCGVDRICFILLFTSIYH